MPRILHLGVGNFFRAHQAWYTQRCPEWNITGVSFRSSSVRDHLVTQDYSYKLVIKDTLETKIETITCLDSILVMVENPEAVIVSTDFRPKVTKQYAVVFQPEAVLTTADVGPSEIDFQDFGVCVYMCEYICTYNVLCVNACM